MLKDTAGEVKGCVALEVFGDSALLRSLAVHPDRRGEGLGWMLAEAVLLRCASGLARVCLLTEHATDFFAEKFGFVPVTREKLPDEVKQSSKLPSSSENRAVAMQLTVAARKRQNEPPATNLLYLDTALACPTGRVAASGVPTPANRRRARASPPILSPNTIAPRRADRHRSAKRHPATASWRRAAIAAAIRTPRGDHRSSGWDHQLRAHGLPLFSVSIACGSLA